MKPYSAALFIALFASPALAAEEPVIPAGTYTLDKHHASLIFSVSHMRDGLSAWLHYREVTTVALISDSSVLELNPHIPGDTHMANIAGIFDSKKEADAAVTKLLDTGFNKENLSLIVSDNARHTLFPAPTDDESKRTIEGGAAGALLGGALGALIAGLTLVGVVVVPGGGLLAVGPLVAALSGAGAGAAVGGLSGALISAGFAVDEAKRYEEEIRHGKAVIVVHTTDEMVPAARVALRSSNATVKAA